MKHITELTHRGRVRGLLVGGIVTAAAVTAIVGTIGVASADSSTSTPSNTGATSTVTVTPTSTPNSASPTSTAPATPSAPLLVTALAGDGQAAVAWLPPLDNADAITGYVISGTTVNGTSTVQVSATGSPVVVTGLENGQAYRFTVTASNDAGTGPASKPSNAVTPESGASLTQAQIDNLQSQVNNAQDAAKAKASVLEALASAQASVRESESQSRLDVTKARLDAHLSMAQARGQAALERAQGTKHLGRTQQRVTKQMDKAQQRHDSLLAKAQARTSAQIQRDQNWLQKRTNQIDSTLRHFLSGMFHRQSSTANSGGAPSTAGSGSSNVTPTPSVTPTSNLGTSD